MFCLVVNKLLKVHIPTFIYAYILESSIMFTGFSK